MSEKEKDAVNYVMGTNGLEDINLTKEDIENIMEEVKRGKKDKSFLYELVAELNRRKDSTKEEKNGRQRI